jgi:hypothetical protein
MAVEEMGDRRQPAARSRRVRSPVSPMSRD